MSSSCWECFCLQDDQGLKLDGVGPVDNRPSTERKKKEKMLHVTCDTWHVTYDM